MDAKKRKVARAQTAVRGEGKPTILDALFLYRKFIRNTYQSKAGAAKAERNLEDFILRKHDPGHRYPEDYHRYDAAEYRDMLVNKGLARSTVRRRIGSLESFWWWMCDHDMAPYNPFSRILQDPSYGVPGTLKPEQVEALYAQVESPEDYRVLLLGLSGKNGYTIQKEGLYPQGSMGALRSRFRRMAMRAFGWNPGFNSLHRTWCMNRRLQGYTSAKEV